MFLQNPCICLNVVEMYDNSYDIYHATIYTIFCIFIYNHVHMYKNKCVIWVLGKRNDLFYVMSNVTWCHLQLPNYHLILIRYEKFYTKYLKPTFCKDESTFSYVSQQNTWWETISILNLLKFYLQSGLLFIYRSQIRV